MHDKRIRTIFLSDLHLGARGCQAERLIEFLKCFEAETIYLVGDIIDGWRLKSVWKWPPIHNAVLHKLFQCERDGARIVYIPGNHDEFMREFIGSRFGRLEIADEAIHCTADGRRLLILHGDRFDDVVRKIPWLAKIGDFAYDVAMLVSAVVSVVRRWLGLPYWSFSQWCKHKVKQAVSYISAFEQAVVEDAARHAVDGVICGHIHTPSVQMLDGVLYINTGDWVESCSAVLEFSDGTLELLNWRAAEGAFQADGIEEEGLQPAA